MPFANLLVTAVAVYLLAWSLYLLALPLLSILRTPSGSLKEQRPRSRTPHISVVIPAHNMELYIGRCIRSLIDSKYPSERIEVYVVADHCSDGTASVANAAGAELLEREEDPPGKTFALDWAFRQLKSLGVKSDLYVIIDATAYVAADFLPNLARRWSFGENVIMAHTIVDPANQKWFARCLGLTLAHRNLQDQARERLSLSALVCGRGMAFGSDYIEKHGWRLALPSESLTGAHPTEDFRHGIRLAEHGYRIAFEASAHIYTPLRHSLESATRQNIRWEKGRIGNAYTHARSLLSQAFRERHLRKFIAAVDAIQPPVAIVIGLSGALALMAISLLHDSQILLLALLPFLLVFSYSLLVVRHGRQEGIEISALLWAPVYIAWRVSAFVAALLGLDRLLDKKSKQTNLP